MMQNDSGNKKNENYIRYRLFKIWLKLIDQFAINCMIIVVELFLVRRLLETGGGIELTIIYLS